MGQADGCLLPLSQTKAPLTISFPVGSLSMIRDGWSMICLVSSLDKNNELIADCGTTLQHTPIAHREISLLVDLLDFGLKYARF